MSGLSGNVELESVDESTLQKDWFASRLKPRQCQNKLDIRAVKFLSLFFFSFGVFPFPLMDFFFFFLPPTLFVAHVGGAIHFRSVLAAAFFVGEFTLAFCVFLFFCPPVLSVFFLLEYIPSIRLCMEH